MKEGGIERLKKEGKRRWIDTITADMKRWDLKAEDLQTLKIK